MTMADIAACIFCSELFLKGDKVTTLKQKGLDGILKANVTSKKKILPSVGDKVKMITNKNKIVRDLLHLTFIFVRQIVPRAMS